MTNLPLYIYWATLISFLFAMIFVFIKRPGLEKTAAVSGKISATLGIAAIIVLEKRLPIFGLYESTLYISFLLCVFDWFPGKSLSGKTQKRLSCQIYTIVLALLLFQITQPMAFNPDFFMYGNIWVNLFFNLRLASAAFFIYAGVLLITGSRLSQPEKETVMKKGRNFLLMGATIYLAGEWSGSFWCLNWLGDSWRWSEGFFKASCVFLLAMTALHLPPVFKHRDKAKAVAGTLPALFLLWMILFH